MTMSESSPAAGQAPLAAQSAVVLDRVRVAFGGVLALENITVTIERGNVTAIVGPNGAGKTTLLNVISGLTRISAGAVTVLGHATGRKGAAAISRLGVGRSFQNPPLIEADSVIRNLLCGARAVYGYSMLAEVFLPLRVHRRELMSVEHAEQICEFADLTAVARAPVRSLPYGTRKRVDIARALMSRPELLLLDEPTSGLDASERPAVVSMLERLRSDGHTTVVLVEHHMDLVRAVATHVVGLQAGAVLAFGRPSEVLDSERFRSAIVGAHSPSEQIARGRSAGKAR
jgi:branched-chain amino acid transport system ATP-binding protein